MRFLDQRAEAFETQIETLDIQRIVMVRGVLEEAPLESFRQYLIDAGLDRQIAANLNEKELGGLLLIEKTHLDNLIISSQPKKRPVFKNALGDVARANGEGKKKNNKKK